MRLWTCARPFTPQTPICRVLRSGGAGAVPARVPDTDVPEAQPALGAARRISQAAASRAFTAYTPLIAQILQEHVPTVGDLDPTAQLIVDGTLLECWSWKNHPEFDLTQAQDHRTQRPGHLHPPLGPPGVGLRPPVRVRPRHRGTASLKSARHPRHRSPARSRASFTY